MKSQEVLDIFKQTQALLSGHFLLRSGLHSDQFFQCALVLQHPRVAERLCRAVAEQVLAARAAGLRLDAVISPALGGILVGHEMGRALDVKAIFAEKQEGKLVLRRDFRIQPGERYLVAEDVMTRGGRIQETMDIVTAQGGVVAAIVVLVDRSEGKVKFDVPVFSLLQMNPVTWTQEDCPLCKQGGKAVKPGS